MKTIEQILMAESFEEGDFVEEVILHIDPEGNQYEHYMHALKATRFLSLRKVVEDKYDHGPTDIVQTILDEEAWDVVPEEVTKYRDIEGDLHDYESDALEVSFNEVIGEMQFYKVEHLMEHFKLLEFIHELMEVSHGS